MARRNWRIEREGYSSRTHLAGFAIASGALLSCAGEFDTTRKTPPRGTLGTELFTLICDRIGAQSLPEDITGQSFHGVCHADGSGHFADRVDQRLIPTLPRESVDRAGNKVSYEALKGRRKYHVNRIERLGAHRSELVIALDDLVADGTIARKDTANPNEMRTCEPSGNTTLHRELPLFLERMTNLYNDGTLPELTRALGRTLGDVEDADDAREALARLEARKGYRPSTLSQGITKPVLSYPGLIDLANTLLKSISTDSDPLSPSPAFDSSGKRIPVAGYAQPAFQMLLAALHEKQRDPETQPSALLTTQVDEKTGWTVLSRPRSSLELAQTLLLATDESFARTQLPETSRYLVKRDSRGVAMVDVRDGKLPSPFVDNDKDGLADIDALGEFVVQSRSPEDGAPSPFHIPKFGSGTELTQRDGAGRAIASDSKPVFASIDLTRTLLSSLRGDVRTAIDPDPKFDALGKVAAGLPVAVGTRGAAITKEYAADPSLVSDWKLRFDEAVPSDLGRTPNRITYHPVVAESSPLYALVHALGQIISKPNTFDALQVIRRLVQNHPKALARIVSVAFEARRIADAHPEAKAPESSTFWDEIFDTLIQIARAPKSKATGRGLIENTITAFGHDKTVSLQSTFAAYIEFRDQLTYNRNAPSQGAKPDVNGPLWNVTTGSVAPLQTPVDRSQPDVGDNRSVLQRFLQLLHDASGLAVCTKQDAVAHLKIKWNGIPINLDYPSDQIITAPACVLVGAAPPSKTMRKCGMLRFENVALLVIDVVLGRAKFDIRDECLRKLMDSPLTSLVGGVDKFLEEASGIKGMSTDPTVAGISRLLYFQTKAVGFNDVPFDPGDTTPEFQTKPKAFLEGVIDVVPSMACKSTPFVDPSDGKTIALRTCENYSETLRVRDANALFPVEQNDFVANIRPLAEAFGFYDNGAQLFIDLFDNLHRHWATTAQPKDVCDPTLPKTDARWCSGDGLVSYEALLVEILRKTDLLASVQDLVKALDDVRVEHCDTFDEKTGVCKKSSVRDGVVVLGDLVRDLVDPDLNKGLKDHLGRSYSLRNDGTKNEQTTPLYLLIDALTGIDKEFKKHPEGAARLLQWRSARSLLVDTFFGVNGTGDKADFVNPGVPKMVNVLVDALASQVASHCPDRTKIDCKWASEELSKSTKETLEDPLFASTIDLLDELQKDPEIRSQVGKFLVYLLSDADHDAMASSLAGIADLLQSLSDDSTRVPIARATRAFVGTRVIDKKGRTIRTSVADGTIGLLSRILARGRSTDGERVCNKELDPNEALIMLLRRAVETKTSLEPSPLDTLANVAAEVNRSDPSSTAKLNSADYKNASKELGEFCLDKGRGLEQIYEVIRQATQ